jgi:hypothetical protein
MTVLEPVIKYLIDYPYDTVDLDDVIEGAERPRLPVLRVMDRLVKDGYLREIRDNKKHLRFGEVGPKRRNPTWQIVKTPVARDFTPAGSSNNNNRDRIWRVIRARRRFVLSDLVRLAVVSEGSARDYIRLLLHYAFIRQIGRDGHRIVYMLVKDTGPSRPITPEVKDYAL